MRKALVHFYAKWYAVGPLAILLLYANLNKHIPKEWGIILLVAVTLLIIANFPLRSFCEKKSLKYRVEDFHFEMCDRLTEIFVPYDFNYCQTEDAQRALEHLVRAEAKMLALKHKFKVKNIQYIGAAIEKHWSNHIGVYIEPECLEYRVWVHTSDGTLYFNVNKTPNSVGISGME